MKRTRLASDERREAVAKAMERYGDTVVAGSTQDERRALEVALIMTVVLTGENDCHSLRDTALLGGC